MIKFNSGPVYTSFTFGNLSYAKMTEASKLIHDVTSARPQGYKYMPSYKNKSWDGFIRLCKGSKLPTGLLSRVISILDDNDFQICIHNEFASEDPLFDVVDPHMFDGITLRPYQVDAIKSLLAYGRGIAKMATNSGKTEVMAAIAKAMPGAVLILTTKKDLLHQTAERLNMRLGEPIGIIGDSFFELSRVTVGTIQTLHNHIDNSPWLEHILCVMYDETHHAPSRMSQEVMCSIPAPYRFGFSGTPLSYDILTDMILVGATGPVIVEVTNAELIENDISAAPIIKMLVIEDGDLHWEDKWQEAYDVCIVHNDERNRLIVEAMLGFVLNDNAQSVLVLVERLAHGRLLMDLCNYPKMEFVHGSDSVDIRKAALDRLRAGDGAIVISTPIFDEGVDVPAVGALILAGGGKGHKKLLQRLGRGMRRKEGNNVLRVIDFVDEANAYLLKHSLARAEIYETEGFDVEVVEW